VRALIDKALLGPSSGDESPGEDFAGVPTWGSPARAEPSSAYIRRVRGFAERMAREVEREDDARGGSSSRGFVREGEGSGGDYERARGSSGGFGAENLSARFQRAGVEDDDDLMEELRSNLPRDDPLLAQRRRGSTAVSPLKPSPLKRGLDARASDGTRASKERSDALASVLERERAAHSQTRNKYEELGAHAAIVLRQRDDARAALKTSTSREEAANARVEELNKRLEDERAASERRLQELQSSSSKWRDAQLSEINAMRESAELRMREANEAAARVDDRIADQVAQYEKRLSEAEREAAKRARDSIGRFGALASSTEVAAAREANALKSKLKDMEKALEKARQERLNATHAAAAAKRDMDEAVGQFESYRSELASSRELLHARDDSIASLRRELRTMESEREDARAQVSRLEVKNQDLSIKVSSLEGVLGDVGGHKRKIMMLKGRLTHLTAEIQRAKEENTSMKKYFVDEMCVMKGKCAQDVRDVVSKITNYYEKRLSASSKERVIELEDLVRKLEDEIHSLKREHENVLRTALEAERDALSNASESSIRASTQRTIEAEKARAVAEMAVREATEKLESSVRERDALEVSLIAVNEDVAALKAERSTFNEKILQLQGELEESQANVRDLTTLLNKRKSASADDEELMERLKDESSSLSSMLDALRAQVEEAKAETAIAVKRAEETAQLEIEAMKRGLEMSADRIASENEERVSQLERELAEALETKKLAREEAYELRSQLDRYEALTKLQDDAMSASKSQVKSLSRRLKTLETSMSGGSPMPSSPQSSPGRSFWLTPGSLTPGSPISRPAPTPITALPVRSPRSPRPSSSSRSPLASPIKSPLFKGLEEDDV